MQRESERGVMYILCRESVQEALGRGDTSKSNLYGNVLSATSFNRKMLDVCWPDVVWIRPVCANSKQSETEDMRFSCCIRDARVMISLCNELPSDLQNSNKTRGVRAARDLGNRGMLDE